MALSALAVAVPLLAGAALAASKPLTPRWVADVVAVATAAAVAVLCSILLARSGDGTLVYQLGAWQPTRGMALGISFAVDPIGAGAALLAALLALGALVFTTRYGKGTDHLFHVLMLVFLAGLVGFCFSGDLFNLFVFFELLSISAFVLAGYNIEQRAPLEGSLNFAIVNSVGSFLFLIGIGLVYGRTGALNLAQVGDALAARPADALVGVAFALVACGLFVKAAIVPFHFWLADAYAVARTPVCIMFAGVMSELGLYGLARVYWSAFSGALGPHEPELRAILVAAGLLTALVGAAMALVQTHLKRLVAFVTICYLGLFLVGVGLLNADGLAGAALFAGGDGFLKAVLFVGIGVVQHRRAHVDLRSLHGGGRDLPYSGLLFAVAALGVASLPPFGSFLGKSLLEHGADKAGYPWLVPLFVAASIVSGAALLGAAARVFLGWGAEPERGTEESDEEAGGEAEFEPRDETPATMFLAGVAWLGAALALGVIPGLADSALHAAERFVDRTNYAGAVLFHARQSARPGAPADTPAWYDWLYGAGSVLGALGLAALLVFRERLPRPRRGWAFASVARAGAGLRALHSGHPGDYVAFVVAGAAILGGLFAAALT